MRANGTRTPAELRKALAVIDAQVAGLAEALDVLSRTFHSGTTLPEGVGDAWNALHDAQTALEAERREVEMNRPTTRTHTDVLIAENRD